MIDVVLKDGRVLRYNYAENADIEGNIHYRIVDKKNAWISLIPIDVVERVEALKPCKIMKDLRDKKRMPKY
jgi:hypothetical protein